MHTILPPFVPDTAGQPTDGSNAGNVNMQCGLQDLLLQLAGLVPKSSAAKSSQSLTAAPRVASSSQTDSTLSKTDEARQTGLPSWHADTSSNAATSEIQPAEEQPDSNGKDQKHLRRFSDAGNLQQSRKLAEASQPGWLQSGHDWVTATSSQLVSKANALWHDEVCHLLSQDACTFSTWCAAT